MTIRTSIEGRDYSRLIEGARPEGTRAERMQRAVDAIWDSFGPESAGQGDPASPVWYSWVGFYEKPPEREEMILLARRDKPACSPLGMHGCCGRCYLARRPLLVDDVPALGTGYIACDPLDKAEVVIPLFEKNGTCWGVLDADSYQPRAFDENDAAGLTALVERLGLSSPGHAGATLRL